MIGTALFVYAEWCDSRIIDRNAAAYPLFRILSCLFTLVSVNSKQ
jgi:hypothetical protein